MFPFNKIQLVSCFSKIIYSFLLVKYVFLHEMSGKKPSDTLQ